MDNFTEAKDAIVKRLQGVGVYAARDGIRVCLDGLDLPNMPVYVKAGCA